MPTYRARILPPFEAFKFGSDPFPKWFIEGMEQGLVTLYGEPHGECVVTHFELEIAEGTLRGDVGDYVAMEQDGSLFGYTGEEFEAAFEQVEE